MSDQKKERVWNDPPFLNGGQSEVSAIQKQPVHMGMVSKRIKYVFIGLIYFSLGVAVKAGILLGLSLDLLPVVLMASGIIFIIMGFVIFRKDGSSRIGE